MIKIHIHTHSSLKIALEDIFQTDNLFESTQQCDATITLTDDPSFESKIPTLYLGIDILIPTKANILIKHLSAIADKTVLNTPIVKGKISLLPSKGTVQIDTQTFHLTDKEIDIFSALLKEGSLHRDELLSGVWQYENGVDTHTVQTHIYRLRKKCGHYIIQITKDGAYFLNTNS